LGRVDGWRTNPTVAAATRDVPPSAGSDIDRPTASVPPRRGPAAGREREERYHHGLDHLTHRERIALVTGIDWMTHLTALFGWMTPGELKHFPLAEREAAIAWAARD
jgi:SpoIIAA-like